MAIRSTIGQSKPNIGGTGFLPDIRKALSPSNYIPTAQAAGPTPAPSAYSAGYDSKGNLLNNSAGVGILNNYASSLGGGAGGGGGAGFAAPSGAPSAQPSAPQIPTPGQPNIDFDALIAPAIQNLNDAIGQANTDYGTQVGSINANSANQSASLNQNLASQQGTLDQSRTTQQNMSQNAEDQARRQYSEIQQGLQSRYGGTTGTGGFAAEIAGQQTLQNIGKTNQDLSSAMKAIDDKVLQVKEVGRLALSDLNQKTQDQLGQAKSQLDNLVLNIRSQQGMLQAQKAQMTAQAIQNYQNSVNSVQQANAQFAQQLYAQQLAAEQNLNTAKAQAGTISSSFTPGAQTYSQSTPVVSGQGVAAGNNTGGVGSSLLDQLKKQYGLTTQY